MTTSAAVTLGKADVTLPDPAELHDVRFLIRNGYAIAYTRGRGGGQVVWEAATTGTRRVSHDVWEVTLTDGRTVTARKLDCNCN